MVKKDVFTKSHEEFHKTCLNILKELNAPNDAKSFLHWYFHKANMKKLVDFHLDCGIFLDSDCFERFQQFIPICLIKDEREKGILKQRWLTRNYTDVEKEIAKLCESDQQLKLQSVESKTNLDYVDGSLKYDLCVLKDENTINFAYSLVNCYMKAEKLDSKICLFQITGTLPSEKSKFTEWFCRDNFDTGDDNEKLNSIMSVAKKCHHDKLPVSGLCKYLVEQRQVLCLPSEKVARTISACNFGLAKLMVKKIPKKVKCWSIWNETLVNECYKKIGKLSGQVEDEELRKAICNSHQDFNSLESNLIECLTIQGYPMKYITGCKGDEYDIEKYDIDMSCIFPLFGKSAKNCITKFTGDKLFNSSNQFYQWKEKTLDSSDRLKFVLICISTLLQSDKQLYAKYQECQEDLEKEKTFVVQKDKVCLTKSKNFEKTFFPMFRCDIIHGNFSKNEECQKKISSLKSLNDAAKFEKLFCSIEKYAYLEMRKCIKFSDNQDQIAWYETCIDRAITGVY